MSTIYKINNNIKHNDVTFEAGVVVDEDAFGPHSDFAIADLVTDGSIEVVDGANTVEEAVEILTKKGEEAVIAAQVASENAPQNTWGPRPDEVPGTEGAENNTDATFDVADVKAEATEGEKKEEGAENTEDTGENL